MKEDGDLRHENLKIVKTAAKDPSRSSPFSDTKGKMTIFSYIIIVLV